MDCSIRVAKIKALISFAVTAELICVFVFAYAKSRFSHDAAHFSMLSFSTIKTGKVNVPLAKKLVFGLSDRFRGRTRDAFYSGRKRISVNHM